MKLASLISLLIATSTFTMTLKAETMAEARQARRAQFLKEQREKEAALKAQFQKEFEDKQNALSSQISDKSNEVRQNERIDQSIDRVNTVRQNERATESSNRVAESRDPRCFYGGVPAYTDSKPGRTDKCERIQTLEDLKKKIGNIKNLEGDCGKGMVMCNPLVFGVDKDKSSGKFKVSCVKASNNSTGLCDKKSGKAMKDNLAELLKDADNQRYLEKFKATLERTCSGNTSSAEAAKVNDPAALQKNCQVLQTRMEALGQGSSGSGSAATTQQAASAGSNAR